MRIASVKRVPKMRVHDLSVADVQHYILKNGVVTHNTAVTYASNQIFIITKAQEKDKNGVLSGYKFTINIFKSRFVKEKSKFAFVVDYTSGIKRWSGLLEMAIEAGYVIKPKNGWYTLIDDEKNPLLEGKMFREKEMNESEFIWNTLFESTEFKSWIHQRYTLGEVPMLEEDEDGVVEEDSEDEAAEE